MALRFKTNQYLGPNAHLLSLQQTPRENATTWRPFHFSYATSLTYALNRQLPEGYIALNEQSLQTERLPANYLDGAISALTNTPTWVVLVMESENELSAVVIRMERYSAADQERIRARMAMIARLHEQGVDLDAAPPVKVDPDLR